MVLYSKKFPRWKVNAVDPGARATGMNPLEEKDETHPKLGAVKVEELVKAGLDGVTGTFSDNDGPVPF